MRLYLLLEMIEGRLGYMTVIPALGNLRQED